MYCDFSLVTSRITSRHGQEIHPVTYRAAHRIASSSSSCASLALRAPGSVLFSGNADSHLSAKLIVLRCVTGMEHAISCKYMDIYVSTCPFKHTSALLLLQNVLQSNDMNCTTPSAGMRGYYQVIAAFFAWTFGGSSRLLGYTRQLNMLLFDRM